MVNCISMRILLVTILLTVTCVLVSESAVIGDSSDISLKLFVYEEKIKALYKLLAAECSGEVKYKRAVDDTANLEVSRIVVNSLTQKLIACRQNKQKNSTKVSTTQVYDDTTTEVATAPLPSQCLSATNLTKSWRMEHNGNHLKPGGPNAQFGYACDFRKDLQWFRFTGAAGK